jgi:hypothetical protein
MRKQEKYIKKSRISCKTTTVKHGRHLQTTTRHLRAQYTPHGILGLHFCRRKIDTESLNILAIVRSESFRRYPTPLPRSPSFVASRDQRRQQAPLAIASEYTNLPRRLPSNRGWMTHLQARRNKDLQVAYIRVVHIYPVPRTPSGNLHHQIGLYRRGLGSWPPFTAI